MDGISHDGVHAAGVLRILRLAKVQPRWLVHLRERRTLLQRIKGDESESRIWVCQRSVPVAASRA